MCFSYSVEDRATHFVILWYSAEVCASEESNIAHNGEKGTRHDCG
jgi:hypothetical protein